MRYVRDGKVYDTEKATQLHVGTGTRDLLENTIETLYATPKGQLFLVTTNHEEAFLDVRPMDEEDASDWLDSQNAPESVYLEAGIGLEEA